MDDLCALAMLLKWPDVELTGITTVAEEQGRRAGYTHYVLNLMGRDEIPVAAGADVAAGYYRVEPGYPPDEENWPEPIAPRPGSLDDALALLKRSVEQGATLVGIGPFTNFALLEKQYPGILREARLFLMGGRVYAPRPGYPQWENEEDWNIQLDIHSAQYVIEHAANLTLIPITVTAETALRRAYLPRLAQAGHLGQLIVRQAEVFAKSEGIEKRYGETCPGLPKDTINFQHDPLACAIALGWRQGVEIETVFLKLETRNGWLFEIADRQGKPIQLVTKIDGATFNDYWCEVICRQ
jgi:inosine-uridine nucleoside N-ribohydrolase